MTLIKREFLRI